MLHLRSTAKVLNQQSRSIITTQGLHQLTAKVTMNQQLSIPALYICTSVIVCAEYKITCVYVCVLTGTGAHRAPPYTQAALPK